MASELMRTEEMSLLGCDIPDTHRPGDHSHFFNRGGGKRWRLRGNTAGLVRSLGDPFISNVPCFKEGASNQAVSHDISDISARLGARGGPKTGLYKSQKGI